MLLLLRPPLTLLCQGCGGLSSLQALLALDPAVAVMERALPQDPLHRHQQPLISVSVYRDRSKERDRNKERDRDGVRMGSGMQDMRECIEVQCDAVWKISVTIAMHERQYNTLF